jgi:hypothetical protein
MQAAAAGVLLFYIHRLDRQLVTVRTSTLCPALPILLQPYCMTPYGSDSYWLRRGKGSRIDRGSRF